MAAKAANFMSFVVGLGLKLLLAVAIVVSIMTSLNFHAIMASIPGFGGSNLPSVPSVSQATLAKASDSAAGQLLRQQGYAATTTIQDPDVVHWLDDLEKGAKLGNPGPYVIFTKGVAQADKPDPNVPPDVVVDANYGVDVALQQTYTNHRGLVCYNGVDIRLLGIPWVPINIYVWDTNLGQPVTLTQNQVPQIPADMTTVQCHTFYA